MRQIRFTYNNKKYLLVLRECPREASKDILEKLAAQCYQIIANQEPHEINRNIYVKRFWVPANGDPLFQFIYTVDSKTYSKAAICSVDLTNNTSRLFTFDHDLPELDSETPHPAFITNHDDSNEWALHPPVLKRLLALKNPIPVKLGTVDFIDETKANTTSNAEMVSQLCEKLTISTKDAQCVKNLYTNSLLAEFAALPHDRKVLEVYDNWVENNLRKHISIKYLPQLSRLEPYLKKQESAAKEKIIGARTAAFAAYAHKKEQQYQQKIASLLPQQYLEKLNRFHYVRKNIMIALYNAACLSYNDLFDKYNEDKKKDFEKLKADIESFNKLFSDIAEIDASSLRLSPLQRALNHLPKLPALSRHRSQPSLENLVHQVLEKVADNDNFFAHVKQQLELLRAHSLQAVNTIAPLSLFNDIQKPTKLGQLSNKIPDSLKIDASNSPIANYVPEFLKKQEKEKYLFELTPEISRIDAEIDEAESLFPNYLGAFKANLNGFKTEILETLTTADSTLDTYFANLRANIHALNTVLDKAESIDRRIGELDLELEMNHSTLINVRKKFLAFDTLQSEYRLTTEEFKQFKEDICSAEVWDETETLLDSILNIKDDRSLESYDLSCQKLLTSSDDILDKAGMNPHLAALVDFEVTTLFPRIGSVDVISRQIQARTEDRPDLRNWTYAVKYIDKCLPLIADCETAITESINYSQMLSRITSYSFIYKESLDVESILQSKAFVQNQLQKYDEAISARIDELCKATSNDNCVVAALKRKHLAAKQNADAALQKYNQDIFDLMFCNYTMSTILNFKYWSRVAVNREQRVKIEDRRNNHEKAVAHKIPVVIFELYQLSLKSDCRNWDIDPQHARTLMTRITDVLAKGHENKSVTAFKDLICSTHQLPDEQSQDLRILNHLSNGLANLPQRLIPAPTQRRPSAYDFKIIPPAFEKYPNAYYALVGAIIGVVAVSAATLICLALIYTGGVPVLATAASGVLALGGPGLISLMMTGAALLTAATCAFINILFHGGLKQRVKSRDHKRVTANDMILPSNEIETRSDTPTAPPQGTDLSWSLASFLNPQYSREEHHPTTGHSPSTGM